MANTYFGSGIIFSVGGVTGTLGTLGALTLLQGCDVEETGDIEETKDASGNVAQVVVSNKGRKITADFYPTSGTAIGNATLTALPIGTTVTLADANLIATTLTSYVTACSVNRSVGKLASAKVTLMRHLENAIP